MMRRRPIWTTNVAAFLVGIGQFAGFVLIPQYVQEPASTGSGFGAGPFAAGLYLLPMTLGVLGIGLATGPLERRFGPRALLIGGAVAMAASFLMLTFARDGRLEVCTASGMLGAGCGIAMAALATLVVSHVARGETGAAAGVNNVARTLGGAIGTQLAAALLTVGAVSGGTPAAHGYTLAFAVGLAAAALAIALGPLLPGRLEDPTVAAAARTAEAAHLA
jgi:MFS family permease